MNNCTYTKYKNGTIIFRTCKTRNIGIIHNYYLYDNNAPRGLLCITRVLTKHPIIWNRYRTNYKTIKKIKGYYVLEFANGISFETIEQMHAIVELINTNK